MCIYSGSECLEKGIGSHVGQKHFGFVKEKKKSMDRRNMNDQRKEVGMQCSLTGEKKDEMGRPPGKNGCKQPSKESRGGKISRTQ